MKRLLILLNALLFTTLTHSQIVFTENGKYGLKNDAGKVVAPAKYDTICPFNEGIAVVNIGGAYDPEFAGLYEGGLWGFITSEGKEITEVKYEEVGEFHQGAAAVMLDYNWALIDKTGKLLTPFKYNGIVFTPFEEGYVMGRDEKVGLVGFNGQEITPFKYDIFVDITDDADLGFAIVGIEKNGKTKYGYLGKDGKEMTEIIYDEANFFVVGQNTTTATLKGKTVTIDKNGKQL